MTDFNLDQVKQLIQLMVDNKLDTLELSGIKITKSLHQDKEEKPSLPTIKTTLSPEEEVFVFRPQRTTSYTQDE